MEIKDFLSSKLDILISNITNITNIKIDLSLLYIYIKNYLNNITDITKLYNVIFWSCCFFHFNK